MAESGDPSANADVAIDRRPVVLSGLGLLADRPHRRVLAGFTAGRAVSIREVAVASACGTRTPDRTLRDRVARLEQLGLIHPSDHRSRAAGARGLRWSLCESGRELQRLGVVARRLVGETLAWADGTDRVQDEQRIEKVLVALADPSILRIGRALVVAPRSPRTLEDDCLGVMARRSLYRRLARLQQDGVVLHRSTREVPRRVEYELRPGWRRMAALVLLSSWWEWRHGEPRNRAVARDIPGLLLALAPLVRMSTPIAGACVVLVEDQDVTEAATVRCLAGTVAVSEGDDPASFARVSGDPATWTAALVSGRFQQLAVEGDRGAAFDMIGQVRETLFAALRSERRATPSVRS